MGMVVNHNIPALQSYNAVSGTMNSLQKSIQKLSTGLRINSAADDAAGLAISEKMRAQIRGLDQAVRNSQDGISMIQTAEGALNETHSILQRMRELSVQAANDTLTQQDRGYIQQEIDQLRDEVTRIGNTTQFNKKKLLDGSAAVLWSSSDAATKAIVKGGLRQIDQFGQKSSVEGNYDITVESKPGQSEMQKTDIFTIKHKNVITVQSMDTTNLSGVHADNLPKGDYVVKGGGTAGGTELAKTDGIKAALLGTTAPTNLSGTANVLLEVTRVNTAAGSLSVTFKVSTEILNLDGTSSSESYNVTITTASALNLTGALSGISMAALTSADLSQYQEGGKSVTNFSKGGDSQVTVQDPMYAKDANFSLDSAKIQGKTVSMKNFYLDATTGKVTTGSVILDIKDTATALTGNLAQFHAYEVGDTANSDIKLRDLNKFWDSQGRFMLTDPQTLTVTQGDGKRTDITLYANDTLGDVAKKINDAIGVGLGQNQYVDNTSKFATFVNTSVTQTPEAVAGTMVIRSAVAGANGKITFAGDEDVIKALSLNTIREAKENDFTVTVKNAHTGETLVNGETITGNKLIGKINANVDVEFDPMADVTVTWSEGAKAFVLSNTANKSYTSVLHLADNTTVFQIGANEGEDMGIDIGDMRASALGLNSVLVTDRDSASRSITVIDNAIDKVSSQRAKLGAYQNRLEHTINNLTVAGENLTAAESRIRDTDMAKEMMNFTKLQIMLQAGTSMLAQANQLPSNVLSLLR